MDLMPAVLLIYLGAWAWWIHRYAPAVLKTYRHASLKRSLAIRYAAKANAGLLQPPTTREEAGPDAPFDAWAAGREMSELEIGALRHYWRVLSGLQAVDGPARAEAESEWARYTAGGVALPPLAA